MNALNAIEWGLPLALHAVPAVNVTKSLCGKRKAAMNVRDGLGAEKKRQGDKHDNSGTAHDQHGGDGVVRSFAKARKRKIKINTRQVRRVKGA